MKKSKIKNHTVFAIILLGFMAVCSCNKLEDNVLSESSGSKSISARKGSGGNELDSLYYYANLLSPTRDISNFKNIGGVLPDFSTMSITPQAGGGGGSGDCYTPTPCNGITFPLQPGWACDVYPPKDTFNNVISCYGHYGSDPRQMYYTYYPTNKNANSPIVVLVHGGGWVLGPNQDNIQGCTFGFTLNKPDNLVKNLLDNGYVVVSVLYRLVKYGNNNSEITPNTTTWQEQINDIDAAILHIKNNFPTCLDINANSIQILGESAGGHLALMWAYTKSNVSYVKSAISMYAPTNLQQYGTYLQSKTSGIYNCGAIYYYVQVPPANASCSNALPFSPFYFPVDFSDIYKVINSFTLTCIPNYSVCYWYDGASGNTPLSNWRIIDTYNAVQSSTAQVIATPNTNSTLATYSPSNALNSSRIIPTFIMHGNANSDHLVPYSQSTTGMDTKFTSVGGLIATLTTTNASVSYNYSTNPSKHLIKLFPGADHGWANLTASDLVTVRGNVITWLNGHK
ncbi:MAG: alpha/beta hydrolase [Sphingobacteriales bacterium]|nr:alpha/beta hydrolase [Sphingobacteriales bacterium]